MSGTTSPPPPSTCVRTRLAGRSRTWLLALLPTALAGCDLGTGSDIEQEPPELVEGVDLELVAEGFGALTYLTSPPGDDRLFITERRGVIHVLENGEPLDQAFLDLSSQIRSSAPEQGLLGMAFHPSFPVNGRFFVSFTDTQGDSRVVEYHAESASDVADPESARLILQVPQPFENHNGGHIAFGPDGMLYLGLGDGGGSFDPEQHGQNRATLLGSLLRIDVDGEEPYAIPPDNPYVGHETFHPEIWAWGLRNPWRFAWDPTDDVLFLADVGQDQSEEVNYVESDEAGLNYGWPIAEGGTCLGSPIECEEEFHLPQMVYNHTVGCAIVGGVVYRGSAIPQLAGHYLFGDACAGWIRAVEVSYPVLVSVALVNAPALVSINSFGEDSQGEVYILTNAGGVVKLVPSDAP